MRIFLTGASGFLGKHILNQCIKNNFKILSLTRKKNTFQNSSNVKWICADLSNLKFYKPKGCAKCSDIGYKGRVGVYEIMTMSPEIEKLILGGKVSEYEMQKAAENQGMVNMLQDGLIKALKGMTSVQEILDKIKN